MELSFSDHLVFLIIGIIIPVRTIMSDTSAMAKMRFSTKMKIQLYWANNLWLWLLCLSILGVWWWNERPWPLLGLEYGITHPQGWSLLALVVFGLLYSWDTYTEVNNHFAEVAAQDENERSISELGFLPGTGKEFFHFIFVALTAGICEEIIFRGYFIRYFQCLLDWQDATYTIAILVPAIIFGVVHGYQGRHAMIKIGAMAILFGYVFVQTGSLWWLIVVHALIDVVGGALAWWMNRQNA